MVLLKEISEGIWGLIVESNQTSEIVTENPFRITMAALDIDVNASANVPTGITRVTLKSVTADKGPATDLILCNLQYPSVLQQPLDVEIYDGQTLTFAAQGPHKVHLTGYNLQSQPEEMHEECHGHAHGGQVGDYFAEAGGSSDEDDDDDDDDDEDDDDDDDESDDDGFPLGRRHRLRDDEDQDLEGDYEDGYVEGEDQLSSESETDEKPKNKKRAREESNGHAGKKTKVNEEKSTATATATTTTKKNKKEKQQTATATTSSEPSTSSAPPKKTNSLEIKDLRVGNGPEAKLGKNVAVYYSGRLQSNNKTFDSCLKGKPFRFRLGAGEVIRGWDQGVKGMRVGGKRQLTIPPSLAYGNQKLPDIPANSTLIFDVELKNVF